MLASPIQVVSGYSFKSMIGPLVYFPADFAIMITHVKDIDIKLQLIPQKYVILA
jgi:hypothetical protein